MNDISFNGKFLSHVPTGVHRVAKEMISAVDAIIAGHEAARLPFPGDIHLEIPEELHQDFPLSRVTVRKNGILGGVLKNIAWEQITLPWVAKNSTLVNLCNIAPIAHGNSFSMIHDAQVYITPDSYSKYFRIYYKFLLPIIGRRAKLIITVSEYSKEQLIKYGVARSHKIAVIHNGCDQVLRASPDLAYASKIGLEHGRYVLAQANTQAHKNIGVLLKAFASPQLQDASLVLFGSAKREDFQRLGHEVPANVRFVGHVSDDELAGLILGACALACPSLTEGFGLPPLEAMRLGCAVIAAPCGALPEVCGQYALYAAPDDPKAWIDQIQRLLTEPAFAAGMRIAGQEHASKFTWERAARKLLDLLEGQQLPT